MIPFAVNRNKHEYVRFRSKDGLGRSDYGVPLSLLEDNIRALDINYPNDLRPLVPLLKVAPDSHGTMEFLQFYAELETVLDQFPILKIIFNSDRFRPMVPGLVSSDMAFMLDPPKAYKSAMSELPMPETPGSKIKVAGALLSKPSGHVDLATIFGGQNLADRFQAASGATNVTSTSTNLDDENASTGGENVPVPRPVVTEWQIDESSELFHAATIMSLSQKSFSRLSGKNRGSREKCVIMQYETLNIIALTEFYS